jgi:DNA-binding transcriptional MerR regulator
MSVTIGRLARAAGCKVQTIRYYEQIGLLPAPDRTQGNQRVCRSADAARLAFIRHARQLGFPIAAVREPRRMVRQCRRGRVAECRVIEVLADRSPSPMPVRSTGRDDA